ncbi:DUF92 domain-containing protein [Dictyobacter arantiisoli]|uniref:DUF92 domain-containing protein n=1 Tax=Dictyobacter arantiisoli TaxID=2014874 RepID=A0A5A5TCU9_9CHLR|nr:DUF92 domain-containing protein [Dictyobacter arantiisoli]GCF09350.1 hypothetical protein KDI_29140 [Dictyobacter arantiisoli]
MPHLFHNLAAIPVIEPGEVSKKSTLATGSNKTGQRLLLGLFLSSAIGGLAYQRRSLSRSGMLGAIGTGTTTFGLGGWSWGLSLIFFFVSSTLFSHFRAAEKEKTAADKFSKGSQRDLAQVAANGGVASGMALAYRLSHNETWRSTFEAGFLGAMATANADTWATELGVLSQQAPRLITTGQVTTAGTSGGVSPLGASAAAAGALAEGLIFTLLNQQPALLLPLISLVSGFAGSLLDSLLGATVQAMYYCPVCQKETEKHIHNCGTPTTYLRGIRWMDNDMVNLLATLGGSSLAMILRLPFRPRKTRS